MDVLPSIHAFSFILVLGAAVLSGCVDDDQDAGGDVVLVTDPSDFSYINNTTQSRAHVHDYWGGFDQLLVLEDDATGSYQTSGSAVVETFHPPAGRLIPLGTSEVRITPTITGLGSAENPTGQAIDRHAPLKLWIKTAADTEPTYFADLENEKTVVFPVNDNRLNDIPHQILSAWAFTVKLEPKEGEPVGTWRQSSLNLSVSAHRGLDLPLFPPHPDNWDGRDQLLLAEHERFIERREEHIVTNGFSHRSFDGTQYAPIPTRDGVIIPHDADRVEVNLSFEPTDENFQAWPGLRYHDATTRQLTTAEPAREEGNTRYYNLPVEGVDSPYALQTSWLFRIYTDAQELPTGHQWPERTISGTYQIEIVIYRE